MLQDRFLVAQGNRRQCKIHLGSGNILMDPMISTSASSPMRRPVRGARRRTFHSRIRHAIDHSEPVFLVAEDASIKDPVILRQLEGR